MIEFSSYNNINSFYNKFTTKLKKMSHNETFCFKNLILRFTLVSVNFLTCYITIG